MSNPFFLYRIEAKGYPTHYETGIRGLCGIYVDASVRQRIFRGRAVFRVPAVGKVFRLKFGR